MNYCNINPMQNNKMDNPRFCQQRIGSKNLINASHHAVLEWESCQASFLAVFDSMTGVVDKDSYVKMFFLFVFFFNIFVLVTQYFNLNLFYMEPTVDNMMAWMTGTLTDFTIFCP